MILREEVLTPSDSRQSASPHFTLASRLVHTSTATAEHIMYNSREEGTMIINDTFPHNLSYPVFC